MKPQRPKTGQSNRGGARSGAGRPVGTPNPNAGRRVTSGPKMTAISRAPHSPETHKGDTLMSPLHCRSFVPRDGIEPPTRGFSVLGKTNGIKKVGSK